MKDYITSYTDILPVSQRERIISELNIKDDLLGSMSENDYKYLINSFISDREALSSSITMDTKLSSDDYNSFLIKMIADIAVMNNENDALKSVVDSYKNMDNLIISDIRSYIDKLKVELEKLKYLSYESEHENIYTEKFKSTDNIESYSESNKMLFTDRDGSTLHECSVYKDTGNIKLYNLNNENIILSGKCDIELTSKVGVPYDDTLAPIKNAVDGNDSTFWGYTILLDGIASSSTIEGVTGVGCTFEIKLPKARKINNLTFKMFEEFPTTISSIKYKETSDSNEAYKVLTSDKHTSSSGIISIDITPINAKSIVVTLNQPNYKINTYSIKKSDLSNTVVTNEIIALETINTLLNKGTLDYDEVNAIIGNERFRNNYDEFMKIYNSLKALLFSDKAPSAETIKSIINGGGK